MNHRSGCGKHASGQDEHLLDAIAEHTKRVDQSYLVALNNYL